MAPVCLAAFILLAAYSASTPVYAQRQATSPLSASGASGSLQTAVDGLIKSRRYNPAGLGVVVKDLSNDSVVVAINPDMPMNPASVQKLITGAAAFELLGPTYTFATKIYTDGAFQADSGIIDGNLYIRGVGEPGINPEKLWLIVQHLRHRGLRKVTGNIAIDDYFLRAAPTSR